MVEMLTPPPASKLVPFALRFARKVRYVRGVSTSIVPKTFGIRSVRSFSVFPSPRVRRSCKLVQNSKLSQSMSGSNAKQSQDGLRVSCQGHCLEDVAILNVGKSSN